MKTQTLKVSGGLAECIRSAQVCFILVAEFFERFAFYSIRGALFIYVSSYYGYSREETISYVHGFMCSVYVSTVFGGVISDQVLGSVATIAVFCLTYALGILFLFGSSVVHSPSLLHSGAFLIALSAGCIKPSISSLGGDQFHCTETKRLASFFTAFYFSVNVSSALAFFSIPVLVGRGCFGKDTCYALGFASSFVSLAGFAAIFLLVPLAGALKTATMKTFSSKQLLAVQPTPATPATLSSLWMPLKKILPVSFGWMLYDQQSSTWIDQGRKLSQTVTFFSYPVTIPPAQMQVLNSLILVGILPFFDGVLSKALRLFRLRNTPERKMAYGMCFFSLSFLFSCMVDVWLLFFRPSILAQVPQFVAITLGEALIGSTGLTLAYTNAPSSCKALILSFWYLNMAIGNLLVIGLSKIFQGLAVPPHAQSFIYLSIAATVTALMLSRRQGRSGGD
ncbi:hypothetical protein NEDG_00589 [Nematocida displodere]|uniref:Solute carrier family 15 (Peptide/histidine transporter), member 3/4 n=1 Tax=Nematocida displodere TaxID=1805483 RepID=A0A177ECJ8_9MICR|nr:hypothetical protein NEDG_00589 [Nematocida displodere]